MDTLAVQAKIKEPGKYHIEWRWHQNNHSIPRGGRFVVCVPAASEEPAALAELRALYYLLEERQVQGTNRRGVGVIIEQSFSSIRKALSKSAIKSTGAGKTQKSSIAASAEFLATKYFLADVQARTKTRQYVFKTYEERDEEIPWCDLRAKIECPALGCAVAVTRHAILRQVSRVQLFPVGEAVGDAALRLEDKKMDAAWGWFVKVLSGERLIEERVRGDLIDRTPEKYRAARYFRFGEPGDSFVIVLAPDHTGYSVRTVLQYSQAIFLERPPVAAGQKLIPAHIYDRNTKYKNKG